MNGNVSYGRLLNRTARHWRDLSIGRKLSLSFGVLLSLMLLVGITGYAALAVIRNRTESSIVKSMEIRAHVLEMDRTLQEARGSHRDFLLQYPKIGFTKARTVYVEETLGHIDRVVKLNNELQRLISESEVSTALQKSDVNVNLYLSSAERYSETFRELVRLVTSLAAEKTGLEARLATLSSSLSRMLSTGNTPGLLLLTREMQLHEKEYLVTRKRPVMFSAYNVSFKLRREIGKSGALDGDRKKALEKLLEAYVSVADRMLSVNSEMRSKLNDFELQERYVDPVSEQLIDHAETDVRRALAQIRRVSRWTAWGLTAICLAGLGAAAGIALLLDRSITRNMLLLTKTAGELKAGNLSVKAGIDGGDEVGTLAETFNTMAGRIKTLVDNLEEKVAERTRRLEKQAVELRGAKEAAEAASRAKSLFLANMSHEIRTPMNAILGFSEIMKEKITDPKLSHYLTSIHTSGKSLLNLINDILDLSKVEAGKLKLEYSAVSPRRLFTEMRTVFGQKIGEKGLEFIIDIHPELPGPLLFDETRMRQILINLIGNAVKFTDTGYIRLSLDYRGPGPVGQGPLELVFKVEDTGTGIPEEQRESIFEAFSQVRGRKLSTLGGSGLGLAITRRLIEMMDGEIRVDSEPGRGSVFTITLKDVEVAAAELPAPGERKKTDFDAVRFEPGTILIADDMDFNREIITGFLEGRGVTLLEAENGREVMEKARKHRPDLILLDMKMPVMDGFEAAGILKKENELKNIPVIAVTASAMKGEEENIRKLCDAYLSKPFGKADLISAIMKFLPHAVTGDTPVVSGPAPEEAPMIPPPAEDMEVLYDLAMSGNMNAILEKADDLEQAGRQFRPFSRRLRELAGGYRDEELLTFVEQYREK